MRVPNVKPTRRIPIDTSKLVFAATALLLVVLVVMPLAWLGYFAFTTRPGIRPRPTWPIW